MTSEELREVIKSCIREIDEERSLKQESNTTGGGASFSPGQGAQHTGKKAFKKTKVIDYSVGTGLKKYKGKKRPYNTKLFDYL